MKRTIRKVSAIILVLFLVVFTNSLYAQGGGQHRNMQQNKEKIEAQKVAFITSKLDLSSPEAEKFWPIFNAYKEQQKSKQKSWRKENDFTSEKIEKMTDNEADEFTKEQMKHEQEMLDLRKGLITDMKGVISSQKILMLLEAEKEFRMELMKRVSKGRGYGEGKNQESR